MFEDTDNKYVESSNKLIDTILNSLDYFKKVNEISFRNEDKVPTVKILKDDYEKLQIEYESIINENQKLKEKLKYIKENSARGNNHYSTSDNIHNHNQSHNIQ